MLVGPAAGASIKGQLGRYCVTGFCRQEYVEAVVEILGAVPVKSLHGCTV
jgi:hypothetical protein